MRFLIIFLIEVFLNSVDATSDDVTKSIELVLQHRIFSFLTITVQSIRSHVLIRHAISTLAEVLNNLLEFVKYIL